MKHIGKYMEDVSSCLKKKIRESLLCDKYGCVCFSKAGLIRCKQCHRKHTYTYI